MKSKDVQMLIERVVAIGAAALLVSAIVAFFMYVSMISILSASVITIGFIVVYYLGVCTGSARQIRLLQRLRKTYLPSATYR